MEFENEEQKEIYEAMMDDLVRPAEAVEKAEKYVKVVFSKSGVDAMNKELQEVFGHMVPFVAFAMLDKHVNDFQEFIDNLVKTGRLIQKL